MKSYTEIILLLGTCEKTIATVMHERTPYNMNIAMGYFLKAVNDIETVYRNYRMNDEEKNDCHRRFKNVRNMFNKMLDPYRIYGVDEDVDDQEDPEE